jgi:hypothetical protein
MARKEIPTASDKGNWVKKTKKVAKPIKKG